MRHRSIFARATFGLCVAWTPVLFLVGCPAQRSVVEPTNQPPVYDAGVPTPPPTQPTTPGPGPTATTPGFNKHQALNFALQQAAMRDPRTSGATEQGTPWDIELAAGGTATAPWGPQEYKFTVKPGWCYAVLAASFDVSFDISISSFPYMAVNDQRASTPTAAGIPMGVPVPGMAGGLMLQYAGVGGYRTFCPTMTFPGIPPGFPLPTGYNAPPDGSIPIKVTVNAKGGSGPISVKLYTKARP